MQYIAPKLIKKASADLFVYLIGKGLLQPSDRLIKMEVIPNKKTVKKKAFLIYSNSKKKHRLHGAFFLNLSKLILVKNI